MRLLEKAAERLGRQLSCWEILDLKSDRDSILKGPPDRTLARKGLGPEMVVSDPADEGRNDGEHRLRT